LLAPSQLILFLFFQSNALCPFSCRQVSSVPQSTIRPSTCSPFSPTQCSAGLGQVPPMVRSLLCSFSVVILSKPKICFLHTARGRTGLSISIFHVYSPFSAPSSFFPLAPHLQTLPLSGFLQNPPPTILTPPFFEDF